MTAKKVYFILPFFECGGVEAWASFATQALHNADYRVYIYSLQYPNYSPSFFGISSIDVFHCPNFFSFLKLVLYQSFREKVIVVSALTKCNLFSLIFFLFPRVHHISSVHLTLKKISAPNFFRHLVRNILHHLILFFSSHIVAVSGGVKEDLLSLSPITSFLHTKVSVIYNPCFNLSQLSDLQSSLESRLSSTSSTCRFVCAGRLHSQKGFDRFISAISLLPPAILDKCEFTLIGNGPLSSFLKNQVNALGLHQKIHFIDFQSDLSSHLSQYDVFILPSVYEGFGNVLAEALFSGLYCISFDCPHGPSEILSDGKYGLLLAPGDVNQLSNAILSVSSFRFRKLYIQDLLKSSNISLFKDHLSKFTDSSFASSFVSLLEKSL